MLQRKAMEKLRDWKRRKTNQALLVDGARQVGKTYLVRAFARERYGHLAEINFLEDKLAAEAASSAANAGELFTRISAFATGELVAGDTLVFLDEVQECADVVTMVKFLVEGFPEYDFVLSGSLLGVELRNVRSVPVGYLDSISMYPLDFEEYCWARGLPTSVVDAARGPFLEGRPVDEFVHRKMLSLFHEYLIVGGMPAAVAAFVDSGNIAAVREVHANIVARYREDISKHAKGRERVVKRVFDLIPAELSAQNKRFKVSDIEGDAHVDRYGNDFAWLADAGVALPCYNVDEPRPPLLIARKSTLFKLYSSDLGLLAHQCGMNVTRDVLSGRTDVLYGAIYENAVAQELAAHGRPLYYFKKAKTGELDFLLEDSLLEVVPVEVKSGKTYKRHSALTRVLATENYRVGRAYVLCEGNVEVDGRVVYAPVYCAGFLG